MNEWEWQLLEDKTLIDCVRIGDAEVRVGDRVRLLPRHGGDVLDIALSGQIATIESLEQDYEGKTHVCVVLDNDPGRDLGLLRQPGHRFFFDSAEIEPLPADAAHTSTPVQHPTILVACIGNIFLGDDGFGVEVAKRLSFRELPAAVKVVDFGIRGFDLAYALHDGYATTILVDAYPHGQVAGAVSLVEPDLTKLDEAPSSVVETHGMNPLNVLRMTAAMNAKLNRILLVGCEPDSFGGEEGRMGLSAPVAAAVDKAVQLILSVLENILLKQQED
jgi:hydrogenase maturation protease